MEWLTLKVEAFVSSKKREMIIGMIAAIGPLYFFKTLYAVWFGTYEVFVGFESEKNTFLVLAFVDFIGFLSTLPSREKGRVMQWVMGLWTVEMFLLYVATIVRG